MKVLVMNFADTRAHFQKHWQYNAKIVKHNYRTVERSLPGDWQLEHHLFIHKRETWPNAVQELTELLAQSHNVTVHITKPPRMRHMFNSVMVNAYETLGLSHIAGFDRIFHLQQDVILINHYENLGAFQVMESILAGSRPDMGWYRGRQGPFDYLSHWVSGHQWARFQHNAAVGPGYLRASKAPLVLESCRQDQEHGEVWIYREMGERCVYMHPNPMLYFGDYRMSWLNPTRLHDLMECTTDWSAFQEIFVTAGHHVRGSLHPFLQRRVPTGEDNR